MFDAPTTMKPSDMLRELVSARIANPEHNKPLDMGLVDDLLGMQKRFIEQSGVCDELPETPVDISPL